MSSSTSSTEKSSRYRWIGISIAVIGLVAASLFGFHRWEFAAAHEETDDAQIEGHVSPVLPRVPGYVVKVFVEDNQSVRAGDALVQIDPQELDLRIREAEAAVKNADAGLKTAEASLADAKAAAAAGRATEQTALIRKRKAASDYARDLNLFQTGAITNSQLADSKAEADTTAAQAEAAQRQAEAAELEIPVAEAKITAARTEIVQHEAETSQARLERSYATVTAPIDGLVSRKAVEVGQFVQAGQTLLSIASDSDSWIIANFKETQLAHLHPGQSVNFTVDAYRDVPFHGKVDSVAGATGAHFALLPPDNSTGNFVKVTQRVPVKIIVTDPPDPDHPLRPGMSVDVTVATKE